MHVHWRILAPVVDQNSATPIPETMISWNEALPKAAEIAA